MSRLECLLDSIIIERPDIFERPQRICPDAGYTGEPALEIAVLRGFIPQIRSRGREHAEKALEYLREYRAYFHIGNNYGISESYACKLIRWAEDTLIKSGEFSLPGKKELLKSGAEYEVILADAAETPARQRRVRPNGL
ncbi:MAG: hypothetical protein Pg6C_14110 [Treponemataceae bacterium]|nr:MAG: hypothetical protein Pg6C_14110 [Treponemataceae bacterium]